MATTNLKRKSVGFIEIQSGNGTPNHISSKGSIYTDIDSGLRYKNFDGNSLWNADDIYITGGTYSNGVATFSYNTGGTLSISGFTVGASIFTGGTVTGPTNFIDGLTSNTINSTSIVSESITGVQTTFTDSIFINRNSATPQSWGLRVANNNSSGFGRIAFQDLNNGFELLTLFNKSYGGNLGIGISSPQQKLHVSGNTLISGNLSASTIFGTTYYNLPAEIQFAVSDETTALTTGTTKVSFRMPYSMSLVDVRASLAVSQTSGSTVTINVNSNGSTIFSTKLTIDNTETTSTTASVPCVISSNSLIDDSEITVDIDQVGVSTVAKGLKILLKGYR